MAQTVKTPTFSLKSVLVRYVPEEQRLSGNLPSPAAFEPDPITKESPRPYLSVNATEVENEKAIADYHRSLWQNGKGKVALCKHTIFQYNDAGKKCSVSISFNKESSAWEFEATQTSKEAAYQHHPVVESKRPYKSPSHCGVEFTRALPSNKKDKFARRMTRQKFHLK